MLEFNNLSIEEKVTANYFLTESKRYFECINENKDFIMFFDLFNKLCNERKTQSNNLIIEDRPEYKVR